MQKRAADAAKAEAGRKLNAVLGEVAEAVAGKDLCVIKFTGIESKGSNKIAEIVKKENPECSFFGVIELPDGKVACFASVPEGREMGAGSWIKEVTGRFGGRGGGKVHFAQGQVAEGTDAKDVVKAAVEVGAPNNVRAL